MGASRWYLPPLITHALLVVGILVFGWSVIELLLLYLIEVVVIHVLFVTAALFAAQPIDNHDADKWQNEPDPIQLVAALPPVYPRNIGLVGKYMSVGLLYTLPFVYGLSTITEQSLVPVLSPTVGLTILAICVTQGARVWRQFLAPYRERSPADAIKVGLWPVHELLVVLLFVFVPITFILVAASFAVGGIESESVVLLAYVIPIRSRQSVVTERWVDRAAPV